MKKGETGKLGEDIASGFLSRKGYRIIERNYRKPWGEIDIIAKHPNGTLVFVEVKTMRRGSLQPEDQMSGAKIRKLRRTSMLFANEHDELLRERRGWQIDLVAITMEEEEKSAIRHYENVG
ncbi:MAG: YraN family protein [Candidatus Liptonbacteria bacterium]|nr:YraN family protein [Candidatus Liptonbacteria bacterium]